MRVGDLRNVPAVPGIEARADAELETGSRVDEVRRRIASRYLGEEGGDRTDPAVSITV